MVKLSRLILLLTVALANAHLNTKYYSFLNGLAPFDESTSHQIYNYFSSSFLKMMIITIEYLGKL